MPLGCRVDSAVKRGNDIKMLLKFILASLFSGGGGFGNVLSYCQHFLGDSFVLTARENRERHQSAFSGNHRGSKEMIFELRFSPRDRT